MAAVATDWMFEPATIHVSGDMYNGDPLVQVFVDGQQVGGTYDITAHHAQNQWQDIQLGSFDATKAHQVQVKFVNDGWDGTATTDGHDRNVYIGSLTMNGTTVQGQAYSSDTAANGQAALDPHAAVMLINGTTAYSVAAGAPTPPPGTPGLVLRVSGDMYSGDPLVQVFVDGAQVGGNYDISAHHSLNQWQDILVAGTFDPSHAHQVQVKFVNDGWDGTATTDGHDRNAYIGSVTLNGVTDQGNTFTSNTASNGHDSVDPNAGVMTINGTAAYSLAAPPATGGTGTTGGTPTPGTNSVTLHVSGDQWQGDPLCNVLFDGKLMGTYDVSAIHAKNQWQDITITGTFANPHKVEVQFTNDAYGGTATADRNLYVDYILANGHRYEGELATTNTAVGGSASYDTHAGVMVINGSLTFNLDTMTPTPAPGGGTTGGTPTPTGPDTLTLHVSGDMYQGDPLIQVLVDGTQVGGNYDISAHHSLNQWQDIKISGTFDPKVAHQIQVKFMNDAWDGTGTGDGHDRNVYVGSVTLDGVVVKGTAFSSNTAAGGQAALDPAAAVMVSNGTVAYSLGGTTGPATGGTGGTGGTTHGLLPDKIIGEWWWPWNPPKISTVEAQAPQVNYLSLVGAFSNAQNNGNVNDGQALSQYGSEAALKADIDAWKASGRIVTGMIGGGGDTTIINNATNVQEFMAAAIPIIDRLGLQGVDFDLENTPDAASVASIISQLKAHYGADFIVSIDPRPYELRAGGVYRQIIQDVGINNIDLIMPQDYALNGDSLAAQRSYMDSDLADWINSGLLPASKLVIGSFDPAEGESVATAIQTYQFYKSVYPSLRGSMYWETREDATQTGWQWAIDMATA